MIDMKAVVVFPLKKDSLHIEDIPEPKPKEDEALIKVIRVGICGTDKEIDEGLYGEPPEGLKRLVIGHESFGVVVALGDKAEGVKVGDKVVATVRRGDNCINCLAGESDMCLTGNYKERGIKGLDGYMSEYYTEKPENLIVIPDELSEEAVLLEPMTIAEKAVKQVFKIQERMLWEPKVAVVFGTGPVGLLTAILLKLRGMKVYAIDRTDHEDDAKGQIISKVGIIHVNSKKESPMGIIEKDKQIDIVVEATGSPEVLPEVFDLAGVNSVIALLSVTGGKFINDMDLARLNYNMVLNNRVIVGVVNANKSYFVNGVSDMARIKSAYGDVLKLFITKRIKIGDLTKDDVKNQKGLKSVIEF